MGIIRHSDGSITIGADLSDIPFSGLHFQIFGDGLNLVQFSPMMTALREDVITLLTNAAVRIDLADHLDEKIITPSDPQLDSLQLYLLCTCIDSLSNPDWLPFHDWVRTRNEKYHISEREQKFTDLQSELNAVSDLSTVLTFINELHTIYSQHHGTQRKFGHFFVNLPNDVQQFLADSYMLFDGDEVFLDPIIQDKWILLPLQEKLQKIALYLFKYRRNDFTHAGKTYPTTWARSANSPQDALEEQTRKGWTPLFFYQDDNPNKKMERTVLARENEVFLLRTAIVGYCRALIGIHDHNYVDNCAVRNRHKATVSKILDELLHDWITYKYYSIDWMIYEDHDDRYRGVPEFRWEWLESSRSIPFANFGIIPEEATRDIEQCTSALKELNFLIQKVNESHPPLYIRNTRPDLKDQPEDEQAKRQAKQELYECLHKAPSYTHARWMLGQLINMFQQMKSSVYGQGGILTYGYSHPDYRKML
ncbi:MAG: hypothetical protein HY872_01715 [Chloroflexi bacterium]|nr:hypothetical protein [Chloroflexota bacterium]